MWIFLVNVPSFLLGRSGAAGTVIFATNTVTMTRWAPDYTKGVFQTLGFKEFHEYLMLPEEKRNSEESKKLLTESIENMKMATRRFARRQNKMVRARFLEHPTREIPPVYELDTTDPLKWDQEVLIKTINIIESYLSDTQCMYEPVMPTDKLESKKNINTHSSNFCEVCERLIIGDKEFSIHLNSNRHMRALKKKKKMAAEAAEEKSDKMVEIEKDPNIP